MQIITSLELLGNYLLDRAKKANTIDFRHTYAKNLLFSERRLINAILRVKLEYMKKLIFHEI